MIYGKDIDKFINEVAEKEPPEEILDALKDSLYFGPFLQKAVELITRADDESGIASIVIASFAAGMSVALKIKEKEVVN